MKTEDVSYLRPASREELKQLLASEESYALLTGGGSPRPSLETRMLVDLQALGLDKTEWKEGKLIIGGLATMSKLEELSSLWPDFGQALAIESGLNVRNTLSLTNWLSQAEGRSPVLCCLRALSTNITMYLSERKLDIDAFLACRPAQYDPVVEELEINAHGVFAFESVSRTPLDLPILCVSVAQVDSGKYRVAVGGPSKLLPVFTLEGYENSGNAVIRDLLKSAEDEWATAEYRQDLGATLLARCLQKCTRLAAMKEAR